MNHSYIFASTQAYNMGSWFMDKSGTALYALTHGISHTDNSDCYEHLLALATVSSGVKSAVKSLEAERM